MSSSSAPIPYVIIGDTYIHRGYIEKIDSRSDVLHYVTFSHTKERRVYHGWLHETAVK